MKVIVNIQQLIAPMALLPVFDLSTANGRTGFDACLRRLRSTVHSHGDDAQTVAQIVQDVARRGDDAVVSYMRKWTDPDFNAGRIQVEADELESAERQLDPKLREAILASIEHVRAYQRHIMPVDAGPLMLDGAEVGLRWLAVQRVGLCVPGGKAVLFSTLMMLAVPAQVAGVSAAAISVVCPPPTRVADEPAGDISPIVLATCRLLGIEKVYRIGGAQAIAALAYGTSSVDPVDLVAGPGNVFVQLAKAQVNGVVGTDNGFYGPSEIMTLADQSADPRRVAADLIAQAEHDPGKCFLVGWKSAVIERIRAAVRRQLQQRKRRDAIEVALREESCAILTANDAQAIDVANTIACEHVNLAVADPDAFLDRIRNGGEVFLGDATPVAAGDYYAGPSHCLPTGTTARFASGVSVYTFLRRSSTIAYRSGLPAQAVDHIARLAEAEGLDGHAASVRVRGSET